MSVERKSVTAKFQPVKRYKPAKKVVHLHWQYEKGPVALRGVVSAVAICGTWKLSRDQVTSFPEDATCPKCLKCHERMKTKEEVKSEPKLLKG